MNVGDQLHTMAALSHCFSVCVCVCEGHRNCEFDITVYYNVFLR